MKRTLKAFLGIALIAYIIGWDVYLAKHKVFWVDEGYEVVYSCAASIKSLFIDGPASQCSKPPLYYVAQKTVIDSIQTFDQSILYKFRFVSLTAATLCLLILFFSLEKALGLAFALLGIVLLSNQPIFHVFAAENRPYMFWLLSFTALTLHAAALATKPWNKISLSQKLLLVFLGLILTLVTGPGMLQLGAVAVVLAFSWLRTLPATPRVQRRQILAYLGLLTTVSFMIGLYYGTKSCHYESAGDYDLLQTKNWGLIGSVTQLFFPITSIVGLGFNLLAAIGMVAPIIMLRQGKKPFWAMLGLVISAQVLLTLPLAVLVAVRHYFFVQRIFLYLIICRALLAVSGAAFLVGLRQKKTAYAFLFACLGLTVASVAKLPATIAQHTSKSIFLDTKASLRCEQLRGKIHPFLTQGIRPDVLSLNFIVGLGNELKACEWRKNSAKSTVEKYVLATEENPKTNDYFSISENAPGRDAQPVNVCGRPVVLEP